MSIPSPNSGRKQRAPYLESAEAFLPGANAATPHGLERLVVHIDADALVGHGELERDGVMTLSHLPLVLICNHNNTKLVTYAHLK